MLVDLQFPFTDVRSFVAMPKPPYAAPSWPAPLVGEEFIRSFGIVRPRPRGGLPGWIAESAYCETHRAIRFVAGALDPIRQAANPGGRIGFRAAFRRLYFDGYAVGKTEIGLSPLTLPSEPISAAELLGRVLSIEVTIHAPDPRGERRPLYSAGKALSQLYAYATAPTGAKDDGASNGAYVFGEMPILLLEMSAHEAALITPPAEARPVPLSGQYPFRLLYWPISVHGNQIWIWWLEAKGGATESERRQLREIRIYLLRLNAEHQALKRVLKEVASSRIDPVPRESVSLMLQQYFNEATNRIGKCANKSAQYSTELDKLAFSVFESAKPGERDALIERLRIIDVKRNIFKKIEGYTSRETVNIILGPVDMTNNVNVSGSGNIVNVASTLTNVQQTIGAMPTASDEDKKKLSELVAQLSEALKSVPADKSEAADDIATQTASLVEAAAKSTPNKTTLQRIGEGLKKGAEFLKDAVPSVLTIAGQIVSIVAKIHGVPI